MVQKIINVLALASTVVSVAVVGTGAYVFVNKDAIVDDVKSKVQDAVLGSLGGLGGGVPSVGADSLPLGSNDLSPTAPQKSAPEGPKSPAVGMGIPN